MAKKKKKKSGCGEAFKAGMARMGYKKKKPKGKKK
jgi:hypothetical protein